MPLLRLLKTYRYEVLAFLTGASVMMLEIVGARLIAPYFGSSTYVWTAMIGVILAALAFGYWYGGRLADRYESKQNLGIILMGAAVLVLLLALTQETVLTVVAAMELDLRVSALLAALLLFGLPSMLIGMVSPHLAKIKVRSLATTGRSIGRLEAATTFGSIVGTFASGYFLLSYLGSYRLTLGLSVALLLTSFLAAPRTLVYTRAALIIVITLFMISPRATPSNIVFDKDTAHSRYRVVRSEREGRPVHLLVMDGYSVQSAAYLDNPQEPVLEYVRVLYNLAKTQGPAAELLVIGGGTHTLPTALIASYPSMDITVAEIDDALTDIGVRHFGLTPSERLHIHDIDGRAYLNRTGSQFDMIVVDAFSSLTPPFHLTTLEAVTEINRHVRPDGIVAVNVVGAGSGANGALLRAVHATYTAVFSEVTLLQVDPTRQLSEKQNFILVATNNPSGLRGIGISTDNSVQVTDGMVLTDDFAPVERLSN